MKCGLSGVFVSRVGWASRPPAKASRLSELSCDDDLSEKLLLLQKACFGETPKPAGGTPTLPETGMRSFLAVSSRAETFERVPPGFLHTGVGVIHKRRQRLARSGIAGLSERVCSRNTNVRLLVQEERHDVCRYGCAEFCEAAECLFYHLPVRI